MLLHSTATASYSDCSVTVLHGSSMGGGRVKKLLKKLFGSGLRTWCRGGRCPDLIRQLDLWLRGKTTGYAHFAITCCQAAYSSKNLVRGGQG